MNFAEAITEAMVIAEPVTPREWRAVVTARIDVAPEESEDAGVGGGTVTAVATADTPVTATKSAIDVFMAILTRVRMAPAEGKVSFQIEILDDRPAYAQVGGLLSEAVERAMTDADVAIVH